MRSRLLLPLLLAVVCLVRGATSASLRWPLAGLQLDDDVGEEQPGVRWHLTWRELSFSGWLAPRESSSSSSPTTTTAAAVAKQCFPPGPECADKILVSPDHSSSCPAGQKKDSKGKCRSELGANNAKKKKKKNTSGKKAAGNKKKKGAEKNRRRKVNKGNKGNKGKKNKAKKQKANTTKKPLNAASRL